MSDLMTVEFCCICKKYIRETNLPFVGQPVALSCGHLFHSTCIKAFKNCPKCNKTIDHCIELNIDLQDEDKTLHCDEHWQELIKQN